MNERIRKFCRETNINFLEGFVAHINLNWRIPKDDELLDIIYNYLYPHITIYNSKYSNFDVRLDGGDKQMIRIKLRDMYIEKCK